MKATKRILCIALTFLLGLALLAPAISAADGAPTITVQAKTSDAALFAGNSLNLEVAATLPAGSTGTLQIDWYDYDWEPGKLTQPIATGAAVTYTVPLPDENLFTVDAPSQNLALYAVAKHIGTDGVLIHYAKSGPVKIMVVQPMGTYLSMMWENLQEDQGVWKGISELLKSVIVVPGLLLTLLPGYFVLWIITLVR